MADDKEMSAAVVDGNDPVTGHIISTTIGGKNGEPKQTISYMAERVVGTGSFGIVFQAKCLETGETVAIKKVLQDRRYKNRELQLMRVMDHPNVISLKHCFFSTTSKNELFLNLVMEYVPESMYRVLKHYSSANQRMPLIYVKLYMYQIFRGLAHKNKDTGSSSLCSTRTEKPAMAAVHLLSVKTNASAMGALAARSNQFPCALRFPSTVSVNFNSRASSSDANFLTSLSSSSHAFTLKCSASSPPPSGDQSIKFKEAAKRGNLVPLFRSIFSDHLTPVLAYRCLVKEDDRDAPSFLFESVEPGLQVSSIGRYSVVGAQPTIEIVAKGNMVTVMDHEAGQKTEELVEDPMMVPQRIMEGWKPQRIEELPEAFCGGWVGYFSYDTVRYVEKKKLPFSSSPLDDRNLPDVHLGLYDDVVVFDHVEKKAYVIHWVRLDQYSSIEEAFSDGMTRLETLVSRVHDINPPKLPAGSIKLQTQLFGPKLEVSSMKSDAYKEAVLQAKEHILAGDIFQIVLSQRFERRTFADPFEIYRALRIVNPSPYMAYLQARGCIMVASSPEILLHAKTNKITNRPLAGTVRRGKTPKEDIMLEEELLKDEKQCAEHIMLVDLGRNDVGKVSKPGSVKVEKLMNIERYSHVMHISSTVTGELLDHLTSWDALRATLPVGTVSGAPKVKAMELIDKLEVTRRGPYSGGFGGISFSGDMDIALTLRTMVFPTNFRHDTMYSYKDVSKRREWVAHIQAGAGIVADSDPGDEQRECENKAAALARAIDLAESSFVGKSSTSQITGFNRLSL